MTDKEQLYPIRRFPDNARVCFIGDSITHGNNHVVRIIDYYRRHFPESGIKFWNCGVSGGSARSALLYLDDDVLVHDPTHAVIMLGVNDSNRTALTDPDTERRKAALDGAFEAYISNMNRLCDILDGNGVEVILCTPVPYAEFQKNGVSPLPGGNALIFRYAESVRLMARQRGYQLADFHARLSELYLNEVLYREDCVHPNDRGHFAMAGCFLQTQGLQPGEYLPLERIIADADMAEWSSLVAKLRNIYASEWMIVCDYTLSYEEKMKKVGEYVDGKKWGDFTYFENLSKDYLRDKPCQNDIFSRIEELT